jgi:hypothetical protein
MNSIEIAKIDGEWFSNDSRTQDQVEAWQEYSTEDGDAQVEVYLEYAEDANYDDHIIDVMNGIVDEYYEGR